MTVNRNTLTVVLVTPIMDAIGTGYTSYRKPEPEIAEFIQKSFG